MLASPPLDVRELFDAMSAQPPPTSVECFVKSFDWSKTLVSDVYYAILNCIPELAKVIEQFANTDRAELARGALRSPEFQERIIELLFQAFPEKRRIIHIHVPKTAGTHLRDKLLSEFPYIHDTHRVPSATSPDQLFAHLAMTVQRLQKSDQIVATGHFPLAWYVDRALLRPSDRLFTVIREPRESLLSLLNYYIRRFQEDPDGLDHDTQIWEKIISFDRVRQNADLETLREFGKSFLSVELFTRHTFATSILGAWSYASAMDLLIRSNMELVPLEAYDAWLTEEWGIDSTPKTNTSPQILRLDDFNEFQLRQIDELLQEDYKLYEVILAAWRKKGGTRVFGSDLLSD